MKSFTFEAQAARVVFGSGCLSQLPVEMDRLGAGRIMLVSTPGRAALADSVRELLGDRVVENFSRAVSHLPDEVALAARDAASGSRADWLVALGGGSAIGVAKAIALTMPVSILAVPTTYGGSEMTPIWGVTREGRKQTGRNPRVQPKTVIYDPSLTIGLSPRTTACSGLNAIAHCIEALYAANANALTSSVAVEGIRTMSAALPRLFETPGDEDSRADALRGAWLGGFSLATVQMALHHKLCHTLGGSSGLPHAETHAVLLPYTAAYNRISAPSAMSLAAEALGGEDAPMALLDLARKIAAPMSLRELGMNASDLDAAAELAVERPYPNPRPVTRDAVRELLGAAYEGDGSYTAAP